MNRDPLNPSSEDLVAEKLLSTDRDFKDLQELRRRLRQIRELDQKESDIKNDKKQS